MILVDIYIPAMDDEYNFMLDENEQVEKIILEITEMVSKKMKDVKAEGTEEFILYSMEQKKAIEKEKTLYLCGIRDGSRLMLV